MQRFARLVNTLANTTKTNDKRELLLQYFREADDDNDSLWLIALFTGRRPKRLVNSTLMKLWCMEETGTPQWLFDESYHTVGDLSEAIALLLTNQRAIETNQESDQSLNDLMLALQSLQTAAEREKQAFILDEWRRLPLDSLIVFNKLIMGGFRIGVSEALVVQALAAFLEKDPQVVAHLLAGAWDPFSTSFQELVSAEGRATDLSRPYPFYLAYPLEGGLEGLGDANE